MATAGLDPNARIAPAVFFQPHFYNIVYTLRAATSGRTVLEAPNYEEDRSSSIFRNFKYIKTFTPMRRFTTSHGATVRFMYNSAKAAEEEESKGAKKSVVSDAVMERVLNRSFMIDPEDRLYKDSILVRFEDGKLNPKATFTALAAFLDLPYTESMLYCSEGGRRDPHPVTKGFDTAPVYKTYDGYANESERYFIEYFLRDAYAYYGYDFHYYDDAPVDEEKLEALISNFMVIDHYIRLTWRVFFEYMDLKREDGQPISPEESAEAKEEVLETYVKSFREKRLNHARTLMSSTRFVNKNGQPLQMMPMLKLDPALLEQPLYH